MQQLAKEPARSLARLIDVQARLVATVVATVLAVGNGLEIIVWCCRHLGEDVTNNIAEYEEGLIILHHINRLMHESNVIGRCFDWTMPTTNRRNDDEQLSKLDNIQPKLSASFSLLARRI